MCMHVYCPGGAKPAVEGREGARMVIQGQSHCLKEQGRAWGNTEGGFEEACCDAGYNFGGVWVVVLSGCAGPGSCPTVGSRP